MFKDLTGCSGFGYDGEKPPVPDHVLTAYLKSHPKASKFRKHKLENFEELDEIYAGSAATGRFSHVVTGKVRT
jgi:hypothetical protein